MKRFIRILWLIAFFVPYSYILAVSVYPYFLPVVIDYTANNIQIKNGAISADIYGNKIKDCQYVAHSEAGYVKIQGAWQKSRFEFIRDYSPGASRPLGYQFFGTYKWTLDNLEYPVTQVLVRSEAVCDGVLTVINQGPWSVLPAK